MAVSTGAQLKTFITSLNGDATIDDTLLANLVDTARAIIEEERPWVVLRKTDTSKSVATSNAWNTAIDLSTITDFSRFFIPDDGYAIRLFDSSTNRIHYYRLMPIDLRLEYKDVSDTAVYDENAKTLYLNGTPPFSGTLYIHYIATSTAIDLTSESAVWSLFPSRFLPIIGFYSVGIYKGAVDYDDINKLMMPENRATLQALKNAMEKWDNEKVLASIQHNDPGDLYGHPRSGAVNRYDI